jgi:hypothetical protein
MEEHPESITDNPNALLPVMASVIEADFEGGCSYPQFLLGSAFFSKIPFADASSRKVTHEGRKN